jgi:hypothetical protein
MICKISHSRSRSGRASTGVIASTRSDRLRSIQSAEPMKNDPASGSSAPSWK